MSTRTLSAGHAELQEQMTRVLRSRVFARANRSQRFLQYLADAALADPPRTVKEYVIAIDVFDRDSSYDPAIDATVRVEASRLRSRLREYYAEEGHNDPVLIHVPKGAYCVSFALRQPAAAPAIHAEPAPLPAAAAVTQAQPAPALTFSGADVAPIASPANSTGSPDLGHWRAFRYAPRFRDLLIAAAALVMCLGSYLALRSQRNSQHVAAHDRFALTPAVVPPPSPAVREACVRGRNYFDRRDPVASEEAFRQAVDLAPDYAPAYTGLANALASQVLLGRAPADVMVPRAMVAAQRALKLDPNDGDALIARGSIELDFLWQWKAAEADLQRGVSLSPRNSYGQMQLAIYYDSHGKVDEAVARMRHAVELDPLSFFMARHYGSTLFYARRYHEALAQLEYARSMHPQSPNVVDVWVSAIYQQQGRQDDAVHFDLLRLQGRADTKRLLATYRRFGWSAYWTQRATLLQDKNGDSCFSYEEGRILLRAGRVDEGLRDLSEAARRHCYWIPMLPVDPELDSYRGRPEYQAIMNGLGL